MKDILISAALASELQSGISISDKEIEKMLNPPPPFNAYSREDPDSFWYETIVKNSLVPTIEILAEREIQNHMAEKVHMKYGDILDEIKVKRTIFFIYKW